MANAQRDALILLPGLQQEDIGESVDLAAARVVGALENEAKSVSAKFVLEEGRYEDYGREPNVYETRIVTVSRQDSEAGSSPTRALDLYGLDYRKALLGDLQDKRPIQHLLSTFLILASNTHKLLLSVGKRSKRSSEKNQVRLGWLFYFGLFLYFLVLVGAVVGSFAAPAAPSTTTPEQASQAAAGEPQAPAEQFTQQVVAYVYPVTRWMQVLVVWITAIGLFLKADLKAWIQKNGLGIAVASQYLTLDRQRKVLEDQFGALLNHLGEKKDVEYRNVHVIGYSFGSIIALDALFPYDLPAAVFRQIDTLVTVGCPFDFIRTYWPTYFEGRKQLENIPRNWINIYSPADVLGSNFMDEGERTWRFRSGAPKKPEQAGILLSNKILKYPLNEPYGKSSTLDEYSAIDKLTLLGFRMHSQYWEGTAAGCYRNIVRELFKGDPLLQ